VCATDGPHRTRHTCTCAHGWETEPGDRGNRRGRMRSGARRWRGFYSEERHRIRGRAGTG